MEKIISPEQFYKKYYSDYLKLSTEARATLDFTKTFYPSLRSNVKSYPNKEAKDFLFSRKMAEGIVEQDDTFEDDLFPVKKETKQGREEDNKVERKREPEGKDENRNTLFS